MNLSDPKYIAFLTIVFILLYTLKTGAQRRVLLLAASYLFYYELSGYYISVLLGVTAVAYYGAIFLKRHSGGKNGGALFTAVCALLLTPLLLFKYLPPMLGLIHPATSSGVGIDLKSFVIPVGISFFSFAALGYLWDVYLEVVEPERRLDRVALFLAFFPVISAGPIERAEGLMPQLDLDRPFSADRAIGALRTIVLGLVLKVFVADLLSGPVNTVYDAPASFSALDQFLATVDYAFYLYADFAGYSLIAIGSARLLGLDVMSNFAQPFLSPTIPEFWRRWHISLSSWVRDYIFSPLRMNWRRHPQMGMIGALFLSFTILGVWHGAKWGYLFFGIIHGTYAIASFLTLKKRDLFWKRLHFPQGLLLTARAVITFLLATLGFVVYRANSVPDALEIYRSFFSVELVKEAAAAAHGLITHPGASLVGSTVLDIKKCMGLFVVLLAWDLISRREFRFTSLPGIVQALVVNAGVLLVLSCWINGHGNAPFVYYKF
jgi:D-alanyl-lipoteichoic acid acyltransferase DltB (MBOAT superfamily)